MDTQNYKRTLAGSVGAGMGALMGASGRTYFILEHKTPSKYHQAGESQKIIVDQVELGRDASCQVRFDESSCHTFCSFCHCPSRIIQWSPEGVVSSVQ